MKSNLIALQALKTGELLMTARKTVLRVQRIEDLSSSKTLYESEVHSFVCNIGYDEFFEQVRQILKKSGATSGDLDKEYTNTRLLELTYLDEVTDAAKSNISSGMTRLYYQIVPEDKRFVFEEEEPKR